jgi:regulator of sirC expression with transglutaminase-like and TPR domain
VTPDLETDFRAFAAAPADTIAGALLVSRLVEPATDPDWCVGELRQLASGVVDPRAPVALVDHLRGLGFAGATQYYEPANSALQRVLETHRGIPISLAMVLLGVARELGLPAAGINFPGHFLVEIADTLVDPFSMSVLDAQERAQAGVTARHRAAHAEQSPRHCGRAR